MKTQLNQPKKLGDTVFFSELLDEYRIEIENRISHEAISKPTQGTLRRFGDGNIGVLAQYAKKIGKKTVTYYADEPTCDETVEGWNKNHMKPMKISDHQTFLDFFQVMGERGAVSEILRDAGVSANDAVKGTADEGINMIELCIDPLVVNPETEKKIIQAEGGIQSMKELLANSAGWDKYQKELEGDAV